jgi:hypothetical protein
MAYNNTFPMTYQPMTYQPMTYQQQQTQPQNTPSSNMIWVQGEAGAKSYLVGPNQTIQLWDSEAQTIYLKSADASGMPTMKILDYTIREQSQQSQNMPTLMQDSSRDYVTREDLAEFEERLKKLFVIRRNKEAHNEQAV